MPSFYLVGGPIRAVEGARAPWLLLGCGPTRSGSALSMSYMPILSLLFTGSTDT